MEGVSVIGDMLTQWAVVGVVGIVFGFVLGRLSKQVK